MDPFIDQMKRLDERRKSAGISSRDLARYTGKDEATFSRWRTGVHQPRMDEWRDVNEALERMILDMVDRLKGLK